MNEDNQVAPTNHNDATIISITESGSKNTSKRNSALPSSLPKKVMRETMVFILLTKDTYLSDVGEGK